MIVLRSLARTLELDRIGQRRSWTVRRPHGVHAVLLRQSPLGDRILLDGNEVARAEPWKYDGGVRFKIDGAPAEIRFMTDTSAGTMWTELYVDGVSVPPDVRRAGPLPATRWGPRLETAAYVLGGALALGGLVGSPIFDAVRQVFWTGAVLLLLAGLRAIDPFGAITVVFDKALEDRPSMLVAGALLVTLAAIARDRWGVRRRVPFIRESARLPRVLGWTAIIVIAFIVLMLS